MTLYRCATLHVPDPNSGCDSLSAARAIAHGMTAVTCNVVDFEATDVATMNPSEHAGGEGCQSQAN